MNESFTLGESIALTLVVGFVPAVISGIVTYFVARLKFNEEIQKLHTQFALQQAGQIATLRQQYITPLRFFASRLSARLLEIERKHENSKYGEVAGWFKEIKDHADNNRRKDNFPVWCAYEGIFSMTTLYYTCSYFQCARQVEFRAPFSQLDPDYGRKLEEALAKVREAFHWSEEGFWDSIQDVIGERFTQGDAKTEYEELCRIIHSQDAFTYGPFLKPIDVYIQKLDAGRARTIRLALDELVAFINSRPTPEKKRLAA